MILIPAPVNDFPCFIQTYFERCAAAYPGLAAIAGKWNPEDLIPGLSDFDTRLIFHDPVSASTWASMSLAVGEVHSRLARERPDWARILEHLPGLNLTVRELTDPEFFYPEFQQWTLYLGEGDFLESIRSYIARVPWTPRDELFHLKKFATYFGPYCRGIDPPINMGAWENKYPLHSRFMHYFAPAVQAAVSVVEKRTVRGKFEALRLARKLFPARETIDKVLSAVERHYENPDWYEDRTLLETEGDLESYLCRAYCEMARSLTLIDVAPGDTPQQVTDKVARVPCDPVLQFFEGAKFSRYMKGRLLFYAAVIPGFESTGLIRHELARISRNFYETPLNALGRLHFGEDVSAETVLEEVRGWLLPLDVCEGVKRFVKTVKGQVPEGQERRCASEVAALFDPVQLMIEALAEALRKCIGGRPRADHCLRLAPPRAPLR